MPWNSDPGFLSLMGAFLISALSGIISLASRIARGATLNVFWIISELGAAMLVGYLAYDLYPVIKHNLPIWITMPIMVSVSAHFGAKIFQWMEFKFKEKYGIETSDT